MPMHTEPLPIDPTPERADAVMVPMRDGARLETDVYRPARPNGGPAVVIRTPYGHRSALTFLPLVAEYLNERGYAVVTQDVRGTGGSEGDFRPYVEIDDGYDTLDWVAAQRWSNGGVVMLGDSYFGLTQWAAIASGHPALRAVAPRGISTNGPRDVIYTNGAFNLAMMTFFATMTVDGRLYPYTLPLDWQTRPLQDLLSSWLPGRTSSSFEEWRQAQPGDRYWRQEHFWRVRADQIRIPGMHLTGWYDEYRSSQISDWRVAGRSTRSNQYLRIDVADHTGNQLPPHGDTFVDFHETEKGIRDYLPRYLDPIVAFYDREARGMVDESLPPVRVEVVEGGIWEGETWPPPSARNKRFHLADGAAAAKGPDGGALADSSDSDEHIERWTHDPDDLVPFLAEDPIQGLYGGLPDERPVEERPDVLTFTSEAMRIPLDLMGFAQTSLQVSGDAPVIQVTAKLVDVFPDGHARRITEGVHQLERPDPTEPVVVKLSDIGYRILPGHRLRLEIAASCFPRWMPVIDPEGDSWTATTGAPVEYQLRVGGGARSHLDVTVTEGEL
ncbi:CocE/NonD family hydrolase [Aeromicrobium sp. CTD01-1L150]|uniref:CocE/NonD family hydrolase n=1 Tax=Aeromicrobium sp. CTD01-1L150 TaxID=3341830 RepID=UPI0035BF16BD